MGQSFVIFEQPQWWLFGAALIAFLLAAIPYFKVKYPWSSGFSWVLASLRFCGVFFLLVLLLDPLLRQVINHVEQPKIAIVYDDSESVKLMTDSLQLLEFEDRLKSKISELEKENVLVDFSALSGINSPDNLDYGAKETDLYSSLKSVSDSYEGQNLAGIVLVSDGIYNRGISPSYSAYSKPVISIGLGDTIPPKDVAIKSVNANDIAYQGNKFPVEVIIESTGYDKSEERVVSISQGGRQLVSKVLRQSGKVDFELEATTSGLNRFLIGVSSSQDETSLQNNFQNLYLDVVEGKERVLIVAPAPHPDISALRRALSKSTNYETEVFIPGVSENNPKGDFDVVVEHQAFARNFPKLKVSPDAARFYILSNRSVVPEITSTTGVSVAMQGNQRDNVTASLNSAFGAFRIETKEMDIFSRFTPISVPFGEYSFSAPVQTLLYQQVGSVVTSRPLLSIYNDGTSKSALLLGTGFWKWRILEGMENGDSQGFDELINKLIQYLSVKADKRKFRFRPAKSDFSENEPVVFNAELYNDIYERLYGYQINLTLIDEKGERKSFEYFPQESDQGFNIGALEEGVYAYTARTSQAGQAYEAKGDFSVRDVNLENLNLTADHDLLKEISNNSGGKFIPLSKIEQLDQALSELDTRGVIQSTESFFPWIRSIWMLVLIASFFTVEWFLRKFYGAY